MLPQLRYSSKKLQYLTEKREEFYKSYFQNIDVFGVLVSRIKILMNPLVILIDAPSLAQTERIQKDWPTYIYNNLKLLSRFLLCCLLLLRAISGYT